MIWLITIPIKIYWKLMPENKRRKCIYKESCSNFVFRISKQQGLLSGIKALVLRYKTCRPIIKELDVNKKTLILTANNKLIDKNLLNL